jgi:3-methylcrotonyl-CoA carboxylase alpha subunit
VHQALDACAVAGVASNLDLLGRIVVHPDFATGGIDTGFIAREAETLLAGQGTPPARTLAIAALAVLQAETAIPSGSQADPFSPWNARDQWWVNTNPSRLFHFTDGDSQYPVSVTRTGPLWRLAAARQVIEGQVESQDFGRLRVCLDGAWQTVTAVIDQHVITLRDGGQTWRLTLPDPMEAGDEEEDAGDRLVAPIPGLVTQVLVAAGQSVTRGQVLVVLEAMKTVFRLSARADTVVASVTCVVGQMVQEGQILVGFKEPTAPV